MPEQNEGTLVHLGWGRTPPPEGGGEPGLGRARPAFLGRKRPRPEAHPVGLWGGGRLPAQPPLRPRQALLQGEAREFGHLLPLV